MGTHRSRTRADLNESDIASARLSPRREAQGEKGDVLTGGDAKRAPHSLSEAERRPMDGASSGTSWDDPDEL
ncbi:hypothetical protein IF650_15850 [Cellulosimicrobium terreum]|nr:hypothetical protein [Cellulosimicrobium terreum]